MALWAPRSFAPSPGAAGVSSGSWATPNAPNVNKKPAIYSLGNKNLFGMGGDCNPDVAVPACPEENGGSTTAREEEVKGWGLSPPHECVGAFRPIPIWVKVCQF